MNHLQYTSLTINGIEYSNTALQVYCNARLSGGTIDDWEMSFLKFILEWIDSKSIVKVKTSGSTGKPKEIELKKNQMIQSALKTIEFLELKTCQTALLCLPVSYIAGKMMIVRAFVGRLNLITMNPAKLDELKNIERVDFAAMVPLQIEKLLCTPDVLKKVKKLIIGGASISNRILESILSIQTKCYETFGMTETVSHIALRRLNQPFAEKYFCALAGVAFSKDNRNCLIVDAPDVADEIIISNDIVNLIDEHTFSFLGRHDYVINSGGVKIYPEELEKILSHHISFSFLLSSIKDESLGELLVFVAADQYAFIIPDLFAIFRRVLSRYCVPKGFFLLPELPVLVSGKMDRKKIQELISQKNIQLF